MRGDDAVEGILIVGPFDDRVVALVHLAGHVANVSFVEGIEEVAHLGHAVSHGVAEQLRSAETAHSLFEAGLQGEGFGVEVEVESEGPG